MWSPKTFKILTPSSFSILVSDSASAKLSTAIAKNTFSRMSALLLRNYYSLKLIWNRIQENSFNIDTKKLWIHYTALCYPLGLVWVGFKIAFKYYKGYSCRKWIGWWSRCRPECRRFRRHRKLWCLRTLPRSNPRRLRSSGQRYDHCHHYDNHAVFQKSFLFFFAVSFSITSYISS